MAQRIKKGDTVVVMRGREKGKTGEVIKVLREENRYCKKCNENIDLVKEKVRVKR